MFKTIKIKSKKSFCILVFMTSCILLSASSFCQTAKTTTDTLIVSVDNHNIFLYSTGSGNHTVIMESGLGTSHTCWRAVDTTLAKTMRVITYDRPGYLNSDSCKKNRDAETIANELKQALVMAKIDPPYIFVGWSLGGSFARVFSALFPNDVKGLVLVDPAPEESYARFAKESPEVLKEDSIYFKEVFSSSRTGEKSELLAFEHSMNQARHSDGRYFAPVILLIASHGKGFGKFVNDPDNIVNRIWVEESIKWAKKNGNVQYKVIESGHHIAKERPDVVVNAILELVTQLAGHHK